MYKKNEYQLRNELLQQLGYTNYQEYLASDLWESIRQTVLDRDKNKCWCCQSFAYQVHHKSYSKSVLLGKNKRQLISVCTVCHKRAETTQSGVKVRLSVANARLVRFRRQYKRKGKRRCLVCDYRRAVLGRYCRTCHRAIQGS